MNIITQDWTWPGVWRATTAAICVRCPPTVVRRPSGNCWNPSATCCELPRQGPVGTSTLRCRLACQSSTGDLSLLARCQPLPTPDARKHSLFCYVRFSTLSVISWGGVNVKGKGRYNSSWEPHLRATGRHLPYGITQCYLPPDTSERAPPNPSHADWYSIYQITHVGVSKRISQPQAIRP